VKNSFAALAALLLLSGCLGYQIGPVKPGYLSDVQTIAVPTFKNNTLIPRIDVLVTGTVIKQFQQDGTFKIGNEDNADAILKAEISRIARSPARSVRGNVLATTEFNLVMRVKYKLVGRDGKTIGPPGEAQGTTSFFVGSQENPPGGETSTVGNVTSDERQAIPLAAEELATHLVSQLSEGW
jgi:lipopolysaccharide assembly LptE-like protein